MILTGVTKAIRDGLVKGNFSCCVAKMTGSQKVRSGGLKKTMTGDLHLITGLSRVKSANNGCQQTPMIECNSCKTTHSHDYNWGNYKLQFYLVWF